MTRNGGHFTTMKIFYKSGATKSAELWLRQPLKVKRWEPRKRDPERLLQECLVSQETHIGFCSESRSTRWRGSCKAYPGQPRAGMARWSGTGRSSRAARGSSSQGTWSAEPAAARIWPGVSGVGDTAGTWKSQTEKAVAKAVGSKEQPH